MPLRLYTEIPPLRPVRRWLNGDPAEVEALRGHPVLVFFWALSCPVCKEQLPRLEQWRRRFEGLQLLGVHTPVSVGDMDEDAVAQAVRELGVSFPVALDGDDGALADAYQVQMTPSFFVFDQEGKLRHFHAGAAAADPVEGALERVTADEAVPAHP